MQTHAVLSSFSSSESWSILSDIERSIKAKIEAVGTPLKKWDIQINYGIKTGFNDAFIIDSASGTRFWTHAKVWMSVSGRRRSFDRFFEAVISNVMVMYLLISI